MSKRKNLNIGMIGGGRKASNVLSVFAGLPGIEVLGITDLDRNAPGVLRAGELGIPFYESLDELMAVEGVDTVMELTGLSSVEEQALALLRPEQEFLRATVAGLISQIVDDSVAKQRALVETGIGRSASDLGGIVEALNRSSDDVRSNVASVADRSSGVASAAEEMSARLEGMARSASEANDTLAEVSADTGRLREKAADIGRSTDAAREDTAQAVSHVRKAGGSLAKLRSTARVIGRVTRNIAAIADRTKRLALNATIQAAKAGEAGQGFAVVAGEVGELAVQTNAATDDIRKRVSAILGSARDSIAAIESIGEVVGRVSHSVDEMVADIREQAESTHEIARRIDEAAKKVDGASTDAADVAGSASQVAEGIGGVNLVIAELRSQADALGATADRVVQATSALEAVVASLDQ